MGGGCYSTDGGPSSPHSVRPTTARCTEFSARRLALLSCTSFASSCTPCGHLDVTGAQTLADVREQLQNESLLPIPRHFVFVGSRSTVFAEDQEANVALWTLPCFGTGRMGGKLHLLETIQTAADSSQPGE